MTVDLIHYITSQDPKLSLSAKFQAYPPVWCLEKGSLSCAAREFRRLVSDLEKHAAKSHKTPSDEGRETRMEASEVLEDFWLKTQTVLALGDITQILFALRELANGKEVVLRDSHTTIQPLQGLGSQIRYPNQEYYVRAFESLLEWSVRRLQFCESRDRDSLWMTLAILDGPYGYNQRYAYAMQGSLLNEILIKRCSIHLCRLITNEGTFNANGVYYVPMPEERAFDRTVPRPQILVPTEKQPLQPLDVELDYARDYLCSGEAKRILAMQSSFGWPLLSIRCVCIYVEADEMSGLIGLLSRQDAPVVVRRARFSSPAQGTPQYPSLARSQKAPLAFSCHLLVSDSNRRPMP